MKPLRNIAGALAALSAALVTLPAAAEDGNISSISQIGSGSQATIQQKFVASGLGQQNLATVRQDGAANRMDIIQEGDGLTALVTQNGHGNKGSIKQYGASHKADVIQNGNGHDVKITQDNFLGAKASHPKAVITGSGPGTTVTVRQY